MKLRELALALACAGCAGQTPAPTQPSAATLPCPTSTQAIAPKTYDDLSDEQLARKLMEVTGVRDLVAQSMERMIDNFRRMPKISAAFLDEFQRRAKPEELIERTVPIYLKHYDRATMIATLRFYESEGGRALIAKLPVVTAESAAMGRAWGEEIARDILSRQRP